MTCNDRLIVFTKYPQAGEVKTRLAASIGVAAATQIHRQLVARTLAAIARLVEQAAGGIAVEIHYAGGEPAAMRSWLGEQWRLRPQVAGDLGRKMHKAIAGSLASGADRCVLIGSDCGELDEHVIRMAFDLLDDHDLVLGPAMDGGYYCVGLNSPCAEIFADMAWGSKEVLRRTLEAADRQGLRTAQLPLLHDIDRPEDLEHLADHSLPGSQPDCSIIIPVLNEQAVIGRTLAAIEFPGQVEVIVVDGGSEDRTLAVAKAGGATVVPGPRGRGRQMNYGARFARGRSLLFLHGDTLLPAGFFGEVERLLEMEGTAAGAFRLEIDDPGWLMRWLEWSVFVRTRLCGLPYGDQAIFCRRQLFREVAGFADLPIMEDFEFIRRLRRRGKIRQSKLAVQTSNRRWQRLGIIRTTLINQGVVLGYYLGISPERLRRWYRSAYSSRINGQ